MTMDELKKALDKLKAEGETEDEMLAIFYGMYIEDEITLENLRTIIGILGYEFTEEFEAMSDEDKKTKGWEEDETTKSDLDKEEIEDAKEFKEGEDKDDYAPKAESETDDKDEDDDDDDKKAARLFGFNK